MKRWKRGQGNAKKLNSFKCSFTLSISMVVVFIFRGGGRRRNISLNIPKKIKKKK